MSGISREVRCSSSLGLFGMAEGRHAWLPQSDLKHQELPYSIGKLSGVELDHFGLAFH